MYSDKGRRNVVCYTLQSLDNSVVISLNLSYAHCSARIPLALNAVETRISNLDETWKRILGEEGDNGDKRRNANISKA